MKSTPLIVRAVVKPSNLWKSVLLFTLCGMAIAVQAGDTTPEQQLQRWTEQASRAPDAQAGKIFFSTTHGREWSCASCHGAPPIRDGKHASTGKRIAPLAPAFNSLAWAQSSRIDKWLRRNCNDVVGRECSPTEKADVLAYLLQLKP